MQNWSAQKGSQFEIHPKDRWSWVKCSELRRLLVQVPSGLWRFYMSPRCINRNLFQGFRASRLAMSIHSTEEQHFTQNGTLCFSLAKHYSQHWWFPGKHFWSWGASLSTRELKGKERYSYKCTELKQKISFFFVPGKWISLKFKMSAVMHCWIPFIKLSRNSKIASVFKRIVLKVINRSVHTRSRFLLSTQQFVSGALAWLPLGHQSP